MKKIVCILLSVFLCVNFFAACGDKINDADDFSNNIAETTNNLNETLVVGGNDRTMNHFEEHGDGHSANPSKIDNDNSMDNVKNAISPTPLQAGNVTFPTTRPTMAPVFTPAPTLPVTATPPSVGEGVQGTENIVLPTPSTGYEDVMNENDDSQDLENGEDDPNDLGIF